jgi:hypothetical protein
VIISDERLAAIDEAIGKRGRSRLLEEADKKLARLAS